MDSAPPNPYRIPVEFSPMRFAILGNAEPCGSQRFAEEWIFMEYVHHDRFQRRIP